MIKTIMINSVGSLNIGDLVFLIAAIETNDETKWYASFNEKKELVSIQDVDIDVNFAYQKWIESWVRAAEPSILP